MYLTFDCLRASRTASTLSYGTASSALTMNSFSGSRATSVEAKVTISSSVLTGNDISAPVETRMVNGGPDMSSGGEIETTAAFLRDL